MSVPRWSLHKFSDSVNIKKSATGGITLSLGIVVLYSIGIHLCYAPVVVMYSIGLHYEVKGSYTLCIAPLYIMYSSGTRDNSLVYIGQITY